MFNECKKRPCTCNLCGFRGSFEEVTTEHVHKCEIKCPNLCGVTCKRSEMEGHKNVCPKEVVECEFSSLGCKVKYRRAEKEDPSKKNHLKHLDFAVEAIKSLREIS